MSEEMGRTPLRWACEDGDLEQVQRLIEKGVDVDPQLLRIAAGCGYAAIVELLIRSGVDINDN